MLQKRTIPSEWRPCETGCKQNIELPNEHVSLDDRVTTLARHHKSISVSTVYTTRYVVLQSTVNCWLANTTVDKLNDAAIDFTSVVNPAMK